MLQAVIPGDHFLGYRIKTDESFKSRPVFLADQFLKQGGIFKVERPHMLYTPADKQVLPNQADLARVQDQDTHLKSYSVRGPRLKRHILVRNQFGRFVGEVHGPDRLLVPTTKALQGEPGLPQGKVDHYLCYNFKRGKADQEVSIADQFGVANYKVGQITRFCNPTAKAVAEDGVISVTNINQPNLHLMCFRVKGGQSVDQQVGTNNQFGRERLVVLDPREVCLPSLKTVITKDQAKDKEEEEEEEEEERRGKKDRD